MEDRRLISKWHKEIFIHCIRNKKPKRPLYERRVKLQRETCPKCKIDMFGRADKMKCYKCGNDYRKNHAGEIVPVLYNKTTKEEKENDSMSLSNVSGGNSNALPRQR